MASSHSGHREPARRERYRIWLGAVACLHALAVAYATRAIAPWPIARDVEPLFVAFVLAPSGWIAGWRLRRRIAAADGSDVVAVTLQAALLGAWIASVLLGLLAAVTTGMLPLALIGLVGAFLPLLGFGWFLVALPCTAAAVLVLRHAAGGRVGFARRSPRARAGAS